VISWLDPRGGPYDARLLEELGETYLADRIGCNLSAMALGQLLRLAEQVPEQFAAEQVGFVGDAIVGRLCGRRAHDATSLSIGMLYNPTLDDADPELLSRLGLSRKRLPELLPATVPAGPLLPEAAEAVGLPLGIPVSPAIHDQYAAGIGAGSIHQGDVCVGTGTAWVLLANASGSPRPVTPRTFVCPHPIRGRTGHLLSMTNGGSALQWAMQLTGRDRMAAEEIDDRLAAVEPGAQGVRVWPLLASTASASHRLRRGARIDGLTLAHSADHLLRAVLEGLACELARHVDSLTAAGFSLGRMVLSGPAAGSRVTAQIIADVTDRPVVCVEAGEMSARGAAAVARAIAEPDASLAQLAERLAPQRTAVQPGPATTVYATVRAEYMEPFDE